MKNHVLTLIGVVLVAGIIGLAQTNDELRQKYGPPDSQGRYIVRPGIGLTAEVDKNGKTREIMVRPLSSKTNSTSQASEKPTVMNSEVAKAILSEVLPVSKRGRFQGIGSAEFGCTSIDHLDYEKVLIRISNRCVQQKGGTYSINIRWKD
jgi:hypothetical protein